MTDRIVIRPAHAGDSNFVAGLVPSLLQFASPAWANTEALAPGFREVLTEAVREDPGVKAGVFAFAIYSIVGFPGSALPDRRRQDRAPP